MNSARNNFVPTQQQFASLRRRVFLRGRSVTMQEMLGKPPKESLYWLPLLRIMREQVVIVPFTEKGVLLATHSPVAELEALGTSAESSDIICNGKKEGCVLCECGLRRKVRFLLPIFVPACRRVGVLLSSTSRHPLALMPQVLKAMRRPQTSGPLKLMIRKTGRAEYSVSTSPVESTKTEWDRAIAEDWHVRGLYNIDLYKWHTSEGRASIASVFISMTNAQLCRIPSVASALKNRKFA